MTTIVLEQFKKQYPLTSPATVFDAIFSDIEANHIDVFQLAELLSALIQDLKEKN